MGIIHDSSQRYEVGVRPVQRERVMFNQDEEHKFRILLMQFARLPGSSS